MSARGEEAISRLPAQGIPCEGRPIREVYSQMLEDVYSCQSLVQRPRCFACIPSPFSLFPGWGI